MNTGGIRDILQSLGIDIGYWLAGFAGGVCSLTYLRGLSRSQAILAVFTSLCCAVYLTPVVVAKLSIADPRSQYGVAFVTGLVAMNIVPLIRATVERVVQARLNIDPTDGGPK